MRYVSIFPYSTNPSIEHVVDLSQPDRNEFDYVLELIKRVGHAYASDHESLLEADFLRTESSGFTGGFIKSSPRRLNVDEAFALLSSAFAGRKRGKDRNRRLVSCQSLENLRQHQSHRIAQ
jgi:hypothetical protein